MAPPKPFTYIRDRIKVDSHFSTEIQAEIAHRDIKAGTTLCFVAREIVHFSKYTFALHGYPLIFVADTYDGKGGAIDTIDHDPESVPTTGAPASGGPGGQPGGTGGNGTSASPITLVAQKVVNARLVAKGNPGGNGGKAANGTNGQDARFDVGIKEYFNGLPGHDGAKGGTGGNGGNGGAIAVHFVTTPAKGALQLDASPGAEGKGGAQGADGKPGKNLVNAKGGKPGKGGSQGAKGTPGKPGKITQEASEIDDWWKLVVTLAGKPAASEWSGYRTRVGEYLFRSYVPALKSRARVRLAGVGLLPKARREFESALILFAKANGRGRDSGSLYNPNIASSLLKKRATTLLRYLNMGLTPIGISYQHDLKPNFDFYEDFITDYQDQREALFNRTLSQLLHIEDKSDKANLAENAKDLAQGMAIAATIDATIAESRVGVAEIAYDAAVQRLKAIEGLLNEVAVDRLDADGEITFGEFVAWASAIISLAVAVVGAFFTSGGTLAAWLGAFNLVLAAKAEAAEVGTWVNDDFELTDEGKAMKGKLTEAIEGTKKLVDKVQAVVALANAEGDDEFDEKERQLLIDAFNAAYEMNIRYIEHGQAVLAEASANQKKATYDGDAKALGKLTDDFQKDAADAIKIARILLAQFQTYVDYFIRYGFKRARAYDIFVLADPPESPRFRFDYGYIHPDLEENAFFTLGHPDAEGDWDTTPVLDLVKAYVDSLGEFDPMLLREKYDNYREGLSFGGSETVSITDPKVLQSMKGSGVASFDVPYAEFEPRTELKIGQAGIGLVGAQANKTHEWVQIDLEHGGNWENRRKDGTKVAVKAPARTEFGIEAALTSVTAGSLPVPQEKERPIFWGRSPATRWRVEVTKAYAEDAGLDLSGLTEIQLAVKYAYYNPTAPAPIKPIRGGKRAPARKRTKRAPGRKSTKTIGKKKTPQR
jgi:hypothetical protein